MALFWDTHAHLDFPDFERDLSEVVARAEQSGIERIITIATSIEGSERSLRLSERFPSVFAAVGIHPNDVSSAPHDWPARLKELASHPKAVAIGEIGLDYYRLPSRTGKGGDDAAVKHRQEHFFVRQLELASEVGLNCVIHQRDCFEEVLAAFEPFAAKVRAVFHCFVNAPEALSRVIALGSLVSFTGIVTYKNAADVRASLAAAPADSFMLETDAPFLAPVPLRGKRCEPVHVRQTAEVAAQTRGCSMDELSRSTTSTAERFFAKSPQKD